MMGRLRTWLESENPGVAHAPAFDLPSPIPSVPSEDEVGDLLSSGLSGEFTPENRVHNVDDLAGSPDGVYDPSGRGSRGVKSWSSYRAEFDGFWPVADHYQIEGEGFWLRAEAAAWGQWLEVWHPVLVGLDLLDPGCGPRAGPREVQVQTVDPQ